MQKKLIWLYEYLVHAPQGTVLKNETQKLLWDFEIQTDHLISVGRPDPEIANKKEKKKNCNCWIVDFTVSEDHKVKIKESEKRNKFLDLAREKQTMEREGVGDSSCGWCTWNNPQRIGKGTGRLGNKRTIGEYPDYSIIKID